MKLILLLTFFILPDQPSVAEPYQVFEENGKVGLKNLSGDVLIPPVYQALGWSDRTLSVINRVTGYKLDNQWGLISITNKRITPPEYIYLVRSESQLLIAGKQHPVSLRITAGCINTAGKSVIPFHYSGIKITGLRAITYTLDSHNQLKYGLIDLTNTTILPALYQSITPLGSLRYAVQHTNNKTALFTENGKQITDFVIDSISPFQNNLAVIYQDGKRGLINRNGEIVQEAVYREITLENGNWVGHFSNQWKILTSSNQRIVQLECDSLNETGTNYFSLQSARGTQLVNAKLQPLTENWFTSLQKFSGGFTVFTKAGKKGVINRQGAIVLHHEFDEIAIDSGYFRVRKTVQANHKWFVYDSLGRLLTSKGYDSIAPLNRGYFQVMNNEFYGALDRTGSERIAAVYDSLLEIKDDLVAVKFRGKYGIISSREEWIVTPQPYPIRLVNRSCYLEKSGNLVTLKSTDGTVLYFTTNPAYLAGNELIEHTSTGGRWFINFHGQITRRELPPTGQAQTVWPATEGLRMIKRNGRYGFVDDQGRLRIPNRYEEAQPFRHGLAAIKIRSKWGFIDKEDNITVQPVYDEATLLHAGLIRVKQNGKYGLINHSGDIIIPVRYDKLTLLKNNRVLLRDKGLEGLANNRGDVLLFPKYDSVLDLDNGLVIVAQHGKYGLINLQGITTIPIIYDWLFYSRANDYYIALQKKDPQKIR